MVFKFHDMFIVKAKGEWDFDTLASAWFGLNRLLDELNEQYRGHTRSKGDPNELDYNAGNAGNISLKRAGRVLITNANDSIQIKRIRTGAADYLGKIKVSVNASDDLLRVTIEDNGTGIDCEVEPHLYTSLFESTGIPPQLLKRNMDRRAAIYGWVGDDLKILREAIQGLGGQVVYKNKGCNVGAIFGYDVPLISLRVPQAQSTK